MKYVMSKYSIKTKTLCNAVCSRQTLWYVQYVKINGHVSVKNLNNGLFTRSRRDCDNSSLFSNIGHLLEY